jgi:MbtH protein
MFSMQPRTKRYRVVVNDQGQYSLFAVDREPPAGWRDAGRTGSREECLAFIEAVWSDTRPPGPRTELAPG